MGAPQAAGVGSVAEALLALAQGARAAGGEGKGAGQGVFRLRHVCERLRVMGSPQSDKSARYV